MTVVRYGWQLAARTYHAGSVALCGVTSLTRLNTSVLLHHLQSLPKDTQTDHSVEQWQIYHN